MRNAHPTFAVCWLTLSLLVAGCDSLKTAKYDNPVMGPPPPRVSLGPAGQLQRLQQADFPRVEDSQIQTASLSLNPLTPGLTLSDSQTVALVNGSPILASEVLERYTPQLEAARRELSPSEYNRGRLALLKKDLPGHIERRMLAQAMLSRLKPEQLEMLDQLVDQQFNARLESMIQEAGVGSKVELERKLREQGTTLANLRVNFLNQQMAMEYMGSKAPKTKLGRPDLIRYYNEHRDDYLEPAEARWQQIVINRQELGSTKSEEKLQQIIAALRPTRGANFSQVAKEFSDGPNAESGGQWDWTRKGSLADKKVDQALFQLPIGQPSQVLKDDRAFKIVLVNERREQRYTPFGEVQKEIEQKLQDQIRQAAARKVIKDLRDSADIVTVFDKNEESQRIAIGTDDNSPF